MRLFRKLLKKHGASASCADHGQAEKLRRRKVRRSCPASSIASTRVGTTVRRIPTNRPDDESRL